MAISDIFSKRRKKAAARGVDVYQYDGIPSTLRVQVVHIWNDVVGQLIYLQGEPIFSVSKAILCREYGWFKLFEGHMETVFEEVVKFFLNTKDTDQALDVIELTFRCIESANSENNYLFSNASMNYIDGINELNSRFRENGVGYQYVSGSIIRVDSTLIHQEVVVPALSFLADPTFKGANDEFLSAHKHYRAGNFDACLNDCLKAFESTLKIIIKKRKWAHAANDTAKKLVEIVFSNKLIPPFMQSHFAALQSVLESGVPTVRNKMGGHGKGDEEREVPIHLAAYALHLTASNVVFLVECHNSASGA
jgi:hypothetical protein